MKYGLAFLRGKSGQGWKLALECSPYMNFIIVVTPGQGGVRDFADLLVGAIQHEHAVQVIPWQQDSGHETVERIVAADCVYLQYSGYGYAKRGAPSWLLRDLLRIRHRIKRFGVFFHELYGFGPPWSSAFWLSPAQRHFAIELSKLSDFWLTNREGSAQWLCQYAGEKPHAVLPVFSNVGEMAAYSTVRAPKAVVFGGANLRKESYIAAGAALFAWARMQGVEIHDIGPPIGDLIVSATLKNAGVVQHGRLEYEKVSRQLSDASFGIVAYPVDYVAKSGVFAAYCAHGVCPVLISKKFLPADGLVAGTHYLAGLPDRAAVSNVISDIGAAAWGWYQPHQVKVHADTLKRLLV